MKKKDPEKARVLSEVILTGLLDKLPESGIAGVEKALEAHNRNVSQNRTNANLGDNDNRIVEIPTRGNR